MTAPSSPSGQPILSEAERAQWLDGYRWALTHLADPGVLADARAFVLAKEEREAPDAELADWERELLAARPPSPVGWHASFQVHCPRCGDLVGGDARIEDVRWGGAGVVVHLEREAHVRHACGAGR